MKLTQEKLNKFLKSKTYCEICNDFKSLLQNKDMKEAQKIIDNYNGLLCGGLKEFIYD